MGCPIRRGFRRMGTTNACAMSRLVAAWGHSAFAIHTRFPQHDVTSDLASRTERADHRQGGCDIFDSAEKCSKSFVIKILTSKPLGLKILQTLFANPAPVAAFQRGGGGGYPSVL